VELSRVIANPLRLTGCGLPPQIVLLCRLLAIAVLVSNHQKQIQTPYLPFLDALEYMNADLLRVMLVGGSLGVLFTRHTRLCAAIAGASLLLAVLSARTYYGNNKTFTGLLFLLSSLERESGPPRLLQWQFGVVYFGAGLNKLLDADWQSGQFFEHWATDRLQNPVYIALSQKLPPLLAGKLFCWTSIVTELTLAVLCFVPRFHPGVIWIGGLFQCGLLLFTGDPFNLFFMAMQSALFAFARWPAQAIVVIWDGSCGFCRRTKEILEKVDHEPIFEWHTLQSGIGDRYNLTREQLKQALYAAGDGWLLNGYSGVRRMILHLPLFWMTALTLFALCPNPLSRRIVVTLLILFLTPLSNPIGNLVYGWIARHRHELLASETCEIE